MGSGNRIFPGWMLPDMPVEDGTAARAGLTEAPLPDKLTPKVLRNAIADVLENARAYDLAEECVRFGLPPQGAGEDGPWQGK